MYTLFHRLCAQFIPVILLLSCLGCTRSRVYNMPFDSMVDHLEKKYAFNFAAEQQGIRYFDGAQMQKMMADDVTDGKGITIFTTVILEMMKDDPGTRIKTIRYKRGELLEYSMEFLADKTSDHFIVNPDTPTTTRISLRIPFSLTSPFGGDAKDDLAFLQKEIDSKGMWEQYCRTRIGAYGKLAIGTIKLLKKAD